jgi:hypothetical protein
MILYRAVLQFCSTVSLLTFAAEVGNFAGMRGAYGKPNGLSARVKINQIMFSIRTTLKGEEHAVEALRKVIWGFVAAGSLLASILVVRNAAKL